MDKKKIGEKGDYNLSIDRYRENGKVKQSHFEIVELGDYISIDNGRVLTEFNEGGNIACIKVSDMNLLANKVEIKTSSHWINETSYKLLPIGSIVFPKRGAAIATNKKRITSIPCLIDNNCMGLTVTSSELNNKFSFTSF